MPKTAPKKRSTSSAPKKRAATTAKNSKKARKGLAGKVVGPTTVHQMVKDLKALRAPRKASEVKLQPYLERALTTPKSGRAAQVYVLSENKVTPNKKQNKKAAAARYNSTTGLGGPAADHFGPIVRSQPIGVTEIRQLTAGNANNVAYDYGITNDQFPAQEITPTRGGQWSGRTGPIR